MTINTNVIPFKNKSIIKIILFLAIPFISSCEGWLINRHYEEEWIMKLGKDTVFYVDTIYIDSLIYPEATYYYTCEDYEKTDPNEPDLMCDPYYELLSNDYESMFYVTGKSGHTLLEDGTDIRYIGGYQDSIPEFEETPFDAAVDTNTVYICIDTVYKERIVPTNYAIFRIVTLEETIIDTATFLTGTKIKYIQNSAFIYDYDLVGNTAEAYIWYWYGFITVKDPWAMKQIESLDPLPVTVYGRNIYMFDIYKYYDYSGGREIIFYLD